MLSLSPLPSAISEIFAQTSTSRQLTLADRYGLLAVLLSDSLTEEERIYIDRLLYALRKGRLEVVNDLSAIQ